MEKKRSNTIYIAVTYEGATAKAFIDWEDLGDSEVIQDVILGCLNKIEENNK